jgi:hypothetical protein
MWARASNYSNSHSFEQRTLPITPLISKQVIPYRTNGGTYCPRVPTPKIHSIVDSSMTIYFTWWNPIVSTNPIHAQTTASILTMVTSHHDRWKTKTLNNNTSQTQHHKDGKTCTTVTTKNFKILREFKIFYIS